MDLGGNGAKRVKPGVVIDDGAVARADAAVVRSALAVIAPSTARAAAGNEAWPAARQTLFFDHLAMTGQACAAAAAAGVTVSEAYSMLRRSARFAERWRRAVDVGYDRLEMALLRQASGEPGAKVDVATALMLLERRPSTMLPPSPPARPRAAGGEARAQAERALLRRLQALAKRVAGAETA